MKKVQNQTNLAMVLEEEKQKEVERIFRAEKAKRLKESVEVRFMESELSKLSRSAESSELFGVKQAEVGQIKVRQAEIKQAEVLEVGEVLYKVLNKQN